MPVADVAHHVRSVVNLPFVGKSSNRLGFVDRLVRPLATCAELRSGVRRLASLADWSLLRSRYPTAFATDMLDLPSDSPGAVRREFYPSGMGDKCYGTFVELESRRWRARLLMAGHAVSLCDRCVSAQRTGSGARAAGSGRNRGAGPPTLGRASTRRPTRRLWPATTPGCSPAPRWCCS